MEKLKANEGKELRITIDGITYDRLPIKTHVIMATDDIQSIVKTYAQAHLQKGDVLAISERVVAITQGRAYKVVDIKASRLAKFLVRFVHKSKYGIGLAVPETMELAIQEVGRLRILLAAAIAALTKPFGIKGMFYHVAGRKAAAIDGPCDYTMPPYNKYATLSPSKPHKVARALSEEIGHRVAIIDANDLGVEVLGVSGKDVSIPDIKQIFRDNPLGQGDECTPLCIVRKTA